MPDRLAVRGSLGRTPPGPLPIVDGFADETRLRAVLREQLRMRLLQLREGSFEDALDPRVDLSALATQQAAVGGILEQRVLESVGGKRRLTPLHDHRRRGELLERVAQLLLVLERRDRCQQLVGKLPPEDGSDPRDLLGRRSEPVEPRHERGVQCRGDGERRPCYRFAGGSTAGPARVGRFQHRLRQLLDEQRHALRALDDLVHDAARQPFLAGDPFDQRRSFAPVEAVESQHRDVRLSGPSRLKFASEGDDEQHGQARYMLHRHLQQLARGRVDPVGVLEDRQQGSLTRQAFELPEQRLEGLFLLTVRSKIRRRIAIAGRNR